MQLTTKQALINYLEFLKESGFLYAEGGVAEAVAAMEPVTGVIGPRTTPAPASAPATPPRARAAEPQRAAPPEGGARSAERKKEAAPAERPAAKPAAPAKPAAATARPTPLAHPNIPPGPLTREQKLALLADGAQRAEACRACPLGSQRTQAVFYDGDPEAKIAFVGEAPGFNEDQQGKPFVGKAGQLLNKMIAAIGFKREEMFICNTLKCRPPQNRDPRPEEKAACEPFLLEQLSIVRPQILVALGAHAAHYLCRSEAPIGKLREQWHDYHGIPLLVTYHPSFLLQKEGQPQERDFKMRSWNDFKMLHTRYCELNPDDAREIWSKKEKS